MPFFFFQLFCSHFINQEFDIVLCIAPWVSCAGVFKIGLKPATDSLRAIRPEGFTEQFAEIAALFPGNLLNPAGQGPPES